MEDKIEDAEKKIKKLDDGSLIGLTEEEKKQLEKVNDEIGGVEQEKTKLINKLYFIKQEVHLSRVRLEQRKVTKNKLNLETKSLGGDIQRLEIRNKELIDSGNQLKVKIIEKTELIKKLVGNTEKVEKNLLELGSQVEQEKINKLDRVIKELEEEHKEIKQLISNAKTPEHVSGLAKIFKNFSEKLNLLIGQVGIFARAINPNEREKLEREIRKYREELNNETRQLNELELDFGKVSTEIESNNRQILHQTKVLAEKEAELREIAGGVDKEETGQSDNIQKQLDSLNLKLGELEQRRKLLSENENEKKNQYLMKKNELQKSVSRLNNELYGLNLNLTRKQNVVENQERELEHSTKRLLEVKEMLRELGQGGGDGIAVETVALDKKKQELEQVEKKLVEAKSKLNKIIAQKNQLSESLLLNEREIHGLENSISDLNQRVVQVDLEQTKFSTKLEDLEEEMSRAGVTLEQTKAIKVIDQSARDILQAKIENLRRKRDSIGGVDPETLDEYEELTTRSSEMRQQVDDLSRAKGDLEHIITELDSRIKQKFANTFKEIAGQFSHYFVTLFNGGKADLKLGEDDEGNVGIEITANPPGKRPQSLNALSGGERTLTSLALLFAILSVNPSPFCVLDEVDAALDESNTLRFIKILKELAKKTQFVIISHNRETMSAADLLYGVTMNENHISKLISVRLEEAKSISK
jgi:chromosome segregation protein